MELVDLLSLLRRRLWLVISGILIGAAAATMASLIQQPRYTTATQVIVAGGSNESSVDEMVRRQLAAERALAYAVLLGTAPAVERVAESVGQRGSNPVVSAAAGGDRPFITIVVTADDAVAAQAIANGYPNLIGPIVTELEQTPAARQPTISVLSAAPLPAAPVSPRPARDIPVGAAIGLIMGLLAAFLRESLDLRLRDSSEIEKLTGTSLLGTVPKEFDGQPLPAITHPRSGRAEAYRHLRAGLEFTTANGMPRSIAISSPAPGEGKSTLAANLALSAARAGYRVILVDADLRKPSVAKIFSASTRAGLTSILLGQNDWRSVLQPVPGENLSLITSGQLPHSPSELLASSAMTGLIEDLERHADLVVIDTPPLLPVSDALVIGVNTDGLVVVARMGVTRRLGLRRALESLAKVNANVLGVVANAVLKQEEKSAYGEGYGYAYGYLSPEGPDLGTPATLQPGGRRRRPQQSPAGGRHARRGRGAAAVPDPIGHAPVAHQRVPATVINLDTQESFAGLLPDPRLAPPQGDPHPGIAHPMPVPSRRHHGVQPRSMARRDVRLDDVFPRQSS